MTVKRLDLAAIVLTLAELGLAAFVYWHGKAGPIPVHYGFDGRVDRWGDRREIATVIAVVAVINATIYALMPALARRRTDERAGIGLAYAQGTALAVSVSVCMLLGAMGLGLLASMHVGANAGGGETMSRAMMAGLAVIILVVGALIGKAGPNPFVGVRTFWALRSRLAWDRSNRLLGRLWFWLGLGGLAAAPIAPQPAGSVALGALMVGSTLAAVFESWRVWRSDPDRAAS
jgi:uncharacterized membrane protein